MATGQNLYDQVRRKLADSDDASFEDATLLAYLNEGIQRFATETHCNQAEIVRQITTERATFAELLSDIGTDVASKVLYVVSCELSIADGAYQNLPLRHSQSHEPERCPVSPHRPDTASLERL